MKSAVKKSEFDSSFLEEAMKIQCVVSCRVIMLMIDPTTVAMGYTALAIGKRVGHSAEKITYRYAHLFPSVQQDMAEQLDAENMEEELNEVEGELANVG